MERSMQFAANIRQKYFKKEENYSLPCEIS